MRSNLVKQALDESGLHYYSDGDDCLLVFRGDTSDFNVLVTTSGSFVTATAAVADIPDERGQDLALRLLQWNSTRACAYAAADSNQLVVSGDLPLTGLSACVIEILIKSVAAAAEELSVLLTSEPAAPESTPEKPSSPEQENPDADINWDDGAGT